MTRTAFIAALPGELKPLVRGWPHSARHGVRFWAQRDAEEEWICACAGMGQDAATRAFAAIEEGGPIDLLFSLGWAGALTAEVAPGSVHSVAGVIDARTGERFHCDAGAGDLWLVTSPIVANRAEKLRLASTYKAVLVDMEAAAIARLAQMREIPFYCLKGVSDGFADDLPDFNRFIGPGGRLQLPRFTIFALVRPWLWPSLIRMGDNSRKAADGVAQAVLQILDPQGTVRTRNGYPDR
jgi:adenosylhomocysteine nucleosidase